MGILSGLFRTRDGPKNATSGSARATLGVRHQKQHDLRYALANPSLALVCRLCQNIVCDGGSCQENRGIMVSGRPDNMAYTGHLIWHRWPFRLAICISLMIST